MKKRKKLRDIIVVSILIIFVGLIYSRLYYNSSQQKVLKTLGEISDQCVNALQKETKKGEESLHSLAVLMGEEDFQNVEILVERLKEVQKQSSFKRMGIILDNGEAYTTDGNQFNLSDREYFQRSMNGEDVISDTLIDKVEGDKINVYSSPIVFKNNVKAVLYAAYDSNFYASSVSTSSYGGVGKSYVVKQNGDFIIGTEELGQGEFFNIYDMMLHKSKKNEESIHKMQSGIEKLGRGNVEFYSDQNYYMYYQAINVNDWYLLMVIPVNVVEEDMNDSLILTYLFGVICAVVLIILAIQFGRIQRLNEDALKKIVYVDEVTGKDSYAKFIINAENHMKIRGQKNYAIICLNVDKFQYINDLYGYAEGNRALTYISEMITEHLKDDEDAARMQADHFVMMCSYYDRDEVIRRICDLQDAIRSKTQFDEKQYEITVTAGIYEIDDYNMKVESMVDRANLALNRRKGDVLTKYTFYDDNMRNEKMKNKNMEDRFAGAIQNHEFVVYYQPKYSLEQNCFQGAEALVRWNDPDRGMISPGEFIPVFEKNGEIVKLDQYVFEEVCRQIRKWMDLEYHVAPISVNVSRLHLYRMDFVEEYIGLIDKYNIPVDLVQLELTETVVLDNESILVKIMKQLQVHGIKILMDDFGSGYSSVNMLSNIPIDVLKIDKRLIDDCRDDGKGQKIITTIVDLARELKIQVTAEGVETKEQYEFLKSIDCDFIQGYYFSKPMSLEEYEKIIKP